MADAEKAALAGVLALSVSLKLWNILDPFRLGFHSDEAILGLMAMHFWNGIGFTEEAFREVNLLVEKDGR